MKKPLPDLDTDEAAEAFVATADLTQFDLAALHPVRFEFQPKDERLNMRLPRPLLAAIRAAAPREGVPYQRTIRRLLEATVAPTQDDRTRR